MFGWIRKSRVEAEKKAQARARLVELKDAAWDAMEVYSKAEKCHVCGSSKHTIEPKSDMVGSHFRWWIERHCTACGCHHPLKRKRLPADYAAHAAIYEFALKEGLARE